VATAVQTIEYLNVVVFGVLAVTAFQLWLRGRGGPALWAALSFGAVGIVVLDGVLLPDEPVNDFQKVVERINIALLVLFPYFLYRFTTTFERAPRGLERLLGLMTSFLDAEESAAVLRDLGPGFDKGALRGPAIAERYPLEQAGTAYARVESGEVAGRVLLLMG
jgi:NADPH:quinone reductase-like Zn-dependent oxidoreductase